MLTAEDRVEFVKNFQPKKMFRVPRDLFPIAVDPTCVSVSEAMQFMRPTDWVIGLRIGDQARCYPEWVLDNYHAVNDSIAGTPIAIMHCEICCSNAAYLANVDGQRLTFGTAGLYGGTASVYDVQTRSSWSHGMGVAFEGPLSGTRLERIESFQATWREWLWFFPETTVMTWPRPACHPEGRHGHGARDTFARPGMYVEAAGSMDVGNDDRLPENEMVLAFNCELGQAALPLRELARAGGLFQTELGGEQVVAISAGPASSFVGSFYRRLRGDDKPLDFVVANSHVRDVQTGSTWRADGVAIDGALKHEHLEPLPTMINKWHSLACFLKDVPLLSHRGPSAPIRLGDAEPVINTLGNCGFAVDVDFELYSLELPNGVTRGFHVTINGDPFNIYICEDELSAEDEALAHSHAVQRGALLLVSSPKQQFQETLNVHALRDDEIQWSHLVTDPRFSAATQAASENLKRPVGSRPSIADLCRVLRANGYETTVSESCPPDTIPVNAVTGLQVVIGGDSFLIFHFSDQQKAAAYGKSCSHSITAGLFVISSDPDDRYIVPSPVSTLRKPDGAITWSRLLTDPRFRLCLESASA
jgi:hypothetical protein